MTKYQSFKRALTANSKGQTGLVVELSKKHLRIFPNDWTVLVLYGEAMVKLHQYGNAEKLLRKAVSTSPKNASHLAFYKMGQLFQAKGEFKKAKMWFRRALRQKSDDATYNIFLGDHLFGSGQISQAEFYFRRASKCSKGPVDEAYFNLGRTMQARGRYTEALKCYRRALKISPKYTLALKQLKDVELAIQEMNFK